jgi:hypothetical protein
MLLLFLLCMIVIGAESLHGQVLLDQLLLLLIEFEAHGGVFAGRHLKLFQLVKVPHIGVFHKPIQLLDDLFGLFHLLVFEVDLPIKGLKGEVMRVMGYISLLLILELFKQILFFIPLCQELGPHLDDLAARKKLVWAELEARTRYRFELHKVVKV